MNSMNAGHRMRLHVGLSCTCQHAHVYALVDAAVGLKDEQPGILHKVVLEGCQEVVILQHCLTLLQLHLQEDRPLLIGLPDMSTQKGSAFTSQGACKITGRYSLAKQV